MFLTKLISPITLIGMSPHCCNCNVPTYALSSTLLVISGCVFGTINELFVAVLLLCDSRP